MEGLEIERKGKERERVRPGGRKVWRGKLEREKREG